MRACLIFLALVASGAYAISEELVVLPSSTVSPKDAEVPKIVPSVESNDSNKTTVKPNIIPEVSSTTTNIPNVPHSKNTTTTTPAPSTTTSTVAPTPTPAPVPSPQKGKWFINGTDAIIVLRMAAQVDIAYNDTNQKTINKEINIPADNNVTKANGDFQKNNELIVLSWKASNASQENSVAFHFNKNEQSKIYSLSSIEVSIDASDLPGLNHTLKLVHSKNLFNTTVGHSYRCVKLLNFNLTNMDNSTQVLGQLKVTDLQFQAFKDDHQSNFGLPEDCASETSDVVPIAVGCVLAGLVVIVLVAYLISRRRSQARGYLSM